jgi:hypothetical protein
MQEATPEMVERWKEVWNEYKGKLLPNRKAGKEVVEYLKNGRNLTIYLMTNL